MPVYSSLALLALLVPSVVFGAPLKVFILAGQSNAQGHGYVDHHNDGQTANGTLEFLTTDERTKAEFGKLKNGKDWASRDDVWIYYNDVQPGASGGSWHGDLTVGYGGDGGHGEPKGQMEMGPEVGLGWALGDAMGEQVLLIKMAWGGKSLDVDFRPPSSGGKVGPFYTLMVNGVKSALESLPKLFPSYSGSYELAGFFWHQGWNDACGPNPSHYEKNLANLIKDVRQDFKSLPLAEKQLPFSIGASGMLGYPPFKRCGGVGDTFEKIVIPAQFAVSDKKKYPGYAGTVATVETRHFHRDLESSPGNQCYHWNNNCESYWYVGKAMAGAMLDLISGKPVPPGPSPPAPPSPPSPPPGPTPTSCEGWCVSAGHCCTGATSNAQHPSCAMGCSASQHTGSVSECKATCHKNDNTCNWNLGGIPQNNCGDCPDSGFAKVQDCLDGCDFGFPASCEDSCAKAGHCCTGATSSNQHPSCAMGCQAARHTGSVSECKATCLTNDNKCIWNLGGIPQDNCGECSGGCGLAEVQECLDGCEFGFGSSMSFRAVNYKKLQAEWNCKLSGR